MIEVVEYEWSSVVRVFFRKNAESEAPALERLGNSWRLSHIYKFNSLLFVSVRLWSRSVPLRWNLG